MKQKLKKVSIGVVKVAFAAGALAYVLSNLDLVQLKSHILNGDPVYLLLAFLSLNVAVFLGSLRLKAYFAAEDMKLPESYSLTVYYIGLFFNTMLPGGIGGDGYITIHLRRKFGFPALKIVRILLTTRCNGLFFLNLCFFALAYVSSFNGKIPYLRPGIIGLCILQFPVYAIVAHYIMKEKISTFIKAGSLSAISQVFSILGAYYAFRSLGIDKHIIDYMVLYLAAAIAGILPVTPGGVGLREFIFFQGSKMIGTDPELAVAASLVYFSVYFVVSLSGLALYLFGNKLDIHHKETGYGTHGNTTS